MENKKKSLPGETWIGLILILFCVGVTVLNFEAMTSFQQFVYGLLTGLGLVFLGAFIYRAAKEYSGKNK